MKTMEMTPNLSQYLTPEAIARIAKQYDVAAVDRAWAIGDYGHIMCSETAETLGTACRSDAIQSYEAGYEGHTEMYLREENKLPGIPLQGGLISVYVQP